MKDRWKIFWTCFALAGVLAIIIGTLAGSFKKVELREYGILYYTLFSTVDTSAARQNGNYLVGLDYGFHKFPRGIISIEFSTSTLTKDMSMVQIQGQFTGRLIMSEVSSMYQNYGSQYLQFLKASVQQYTRQSIQYYSLSQLINDRSAIQNNVKGEVCLKVQSDYPWIQCDYVSLGRVGANIPDPEIVEIEKSYEQERIRLFERQILAQKKINFYNSGGSQLLANLGKLDSELFLNVTKIIATAANFMTEQSLQGQKAINLLLSSKFPTIKNTLTLKI